MRIICPECGFTRNVPDDKVPASSAVATCPKCRHRFRFRDFEDGGEAGGWAGEPPIPEPRLPGEGEDARPAVDAPRTIPGAARRGRMAGPQGHWPDPDAVSRDADEFSPREPFSGPGTNRGFPPPSAHWEPAESDDGPGQPASEDVASGGPPEVGHTPDRLSVDVGTVEPLRRATGVGKEPASEQNGVRDIWARLQAMDDEDEPRPVTPRPVRTSASHAAEPARGDDDSESFHAPRGIAPEPSPTPGTPPPEQRASRTEPGYGQAGGPDAPHRDVSGRESDAVSPDLPEQARPAGADSQDPGEVPWERLDVYGFFPGLVLTLKRILFQPVEFFEAMPSGRGKGKALVFNLLLSEFLLAVDFLWALLGVRAKIADTGQTDALAAMAGVPGVGFLILLIMVPLFMAAGVYLDAGLTHLLLMLLRGNGKGFDATFRVMCYSSAPTVLSAVPVAGQLLSPVVLIWYMTLQAIGLKKVHGAAYSQTLAVVLIKWSLYLFILLGVLHGLSGGG